MKVVDFHCDTLSELRRAALKGEPKSFLDNDLHIDLHKLEKGDYMLQCFAAFIYLGNQEENPLVTALEEFDQFFQMMKAYPDRIAQVKTWEDLEANRKAGRISALMTIEEGGCCLDNLAVLRILYELGVRIMTLTWNFENGLAYPNQVPGDSHVVYPFVANTDKGLKEKGFAFIREMERLGIIIDVSHLSDAGFWDVANHTSRPFIASHSNARAVCGHVRNLTDDMIRTISDRGGLTGINYCAAFLDDPMKPADEQFSRVSYMADHIEYIRQKGGIEMIGLGSDFDGIEHNLEMYDCSCLPMLEAELHRRRYSDDAIEKIFWGNALRVLKEFL